MSHRLRERFRDNCSNVGITEVIELLLIIHEEIMTKLDQLQAAVQAEDTVIASAVTLINGIAQRIADAGVDPAALQALTDDITSQAATLAAAVSANTPTPAGS